MKISYGHNGVLIEHGGQVPDIQWMLDELAWHYPEIVTREYPEALSIGGVRGTDAWNAVAHIVDAFEK